MYIYGLGIWAVIDKFYTIRIRRNFYSMQTRGEKIKNHKNNCGGPIISDKFEENNKFWIMAMQSSYFPLT